jgi:hypothetical protein
MLEQGYSHIDVSVTSTSGARVQKVVEPQAGVPSHLLNRATDTTVQVLA